jgi:hypothetical protein
VEESRAASRVGSRTGSPGPSSSRLGLREQGLEGVGRGSEVDEVEVFERLVERAGRGRGLGAVWLDGVSVSVGVGLRLLRLAPQLLNCMWHWAEPRSDYRFHGHSQFHPLLLAANPDRHLPLRDPRSFSCLDPKTAIIVLAYILEMVFSWIDRTPKSTSRSAGGKTRTTVGCLCPNAE